MTLVIPSLAMGGAERVMSTLANEWVKAGVAVTLITFDGGRIPPFFPLHPSVRHQAIELGTAVRVPGRIFQNMVRISLLRKAVKASRPELVLSFMDIANILTLMATCGSGVPIVIAERSNPFLAPIPRAWQALRPWTYRLASRLVIQTQASAEFFLPAFAGKLAVIPNPVSPPMAGTLRLRDLPDRERVILGLGRLIGYKGFDHLIKAFHRICRRHPLWSLRIHGEGPARAGLESLVESLGLADQVSLPGAIPDTYASLADSQIFALTSRFEGFPNALCEAMACGLAVVATDCPHGPREIIKPGENGFLVPVDDEQALADALEELIRNPAKRAEMGKNAARRAARFGLENVLSQWKDVLEGAAGAPLGPMAGAAASPGRKMEFTSGMTSDQALRPLSQKG